MLDSWTATPRRVQLPDLWTLRWHCKWDTTKFNYQTISNTIKNEYKHG